MNTNAQRQPTPFHMENLQRICKALQEDLEAREFEVMAMSTFDMDALDELHTRQTKVAQIHTWCNNMGLKYFPPPEPRIQAAGLNGMRSIN